MFSTGGLSMLLVHGKGKPQKGLCHWEKRLFFEALNKVRFFYAASQSQAAQAYEQMSVGQALNLTQSFPSLGKYLVNGISYYLHYIFRTLSIVH